MILVGASIVLVVFMLVPSVAQEKGTKKVKPGESQKAWYSRLQPQAVLVIEDKIP